MKTNGNGQGAILTPEELRLLFTDGLRSPRSRALFGVCLYTACRISEALALRTTDIAGTVITFRRATTKGKLRTRAIHIHPGLEAILADYRPYPCLGALFPGQRGLSEYLTRGSADKMLRAACHRVGLVGISTHSFRRTALTQMSSAGVPLRHIQEISGHSDLGTLQRYLEVSEEQRREASAAIGF